MNGVFPSIHKHYRMLTISLPDTRENNETLFSTIMKDSFHLILGAQILYLFKYNHYVSLQYFQLI